MRKYLLDVVKDNVTKIGQILLWIEYWYFLRVCFCLTCLHLLKNKSKMFGNVCLCTSLCYCTGIFTIMSVSASRNPQTKTKRNQKHEIVWTVHSKTKSSRSTAQVEQVVQTPPQKTNPSLCQFCVKWYFTLSAYLTSPATKNSSGVSSSFALYLAMSFSAIG